MIVDETVLVCVGVVVAALAVPVAVGVLRAVME